jgi:predicted DNA-binding protein (MmcQ/YjbR family)
MSESGDDAGRPVPEAVQAQVEALRQVCLAYPEAAEEFPWGHSAFKVRKKTFLFLAGNPDGVSLSAKLPDSNEGALTLPFTTPTGYGLGRSGWVSAKFASDDDLPMPLLEAWIDESYRAVAPKKLVKTLPDPPSD